MGSTLYWVGADVHGPRYGWSMRQASAMLLVPDNISQRIIILVIEVISGLSQGLYV